MTDLLREVQEYPATKLLVKGLAEERNGPRTCAAPGPNLITDPDCGDFTHPAGSSAR